MPHQCTNCGRTFADGSKEMLSGCPDCGGNKFQFSPEGESADFEFGSDSTGPEESDASHPTRTEEATGTAGSTPSDAPDRDAARDSPVSEAESEPAQTRERSSSLGGVGNRDAADREAVEGEAADRRSGGERDGSSEFDAEDRAQTSARSDVVSEDELSAAARDVPSGSNPPSDSRDGPPSSEGEVIEPAGDERPELNELRAELNDQFESIKILNPGQYELNLMELYDRDEYIISLREDGRYVIEVPGNWREDDV